MSAPCFPIWDTWLTFPFTHPQKMHYCPCCCVHRKTVSLLFDQKYPLWFTFSLCIIRNVHKVSMIVKVDTFMYTGTVAHKGTSKSPWGSFALNWVFIYQVFSTNRPVSRTFVTQYPYRHCHYLNDKVYAKDTVTCKKHESVSHPKNSSKGLWDKWFTNYILDVLCR